MLQERLSQLIESAGPRDLVEIVLLAACIFFILRLLGKTRSASMVRGLGLVIVVVFLVAQVFITIFDLTVLARVMDHLLTTAMVGLLVIFHPELRRGLMVLGEYRIFRFLARNEPVSMADRLSEAARAMSNDGIGALIAIEREMALAPYIETGERVESAVSVRLIRSIFAKRSPLHDGALVISQGRITAAACQLPLGQPPDGVHMGMRHRSALALSDETDAIVLVVSEESGRISLGVRGRLEVVAPGELSERLTALLSERPLTARLPRLIMRLPIRAEVFVGQDSDPVG